MNPGLGCATGLLALTCARARSRDFPWERIRKATVTVTERERPAKQWMRTFVACERVGVGGGGRGGRIERKE